jgi:hypothetical protein
VKERGERDAGERKRENRGEEKEERENHFLIILFHSNMSSLEYKRHLNRLTY